MTVFSNFCKYGIVAAGGAAPVPVAPDPYFSNVVLLLHCEGSNGGTTFTDSGPDSRTVSVSGAAVTSTTRSKWGSSSLSLPSNGYLSVPASSAWDFDAVDGTVEFWSYFTSITYPYPIIGTVEPSGNWFVYPRATGKIYIGINGVNEVSTAAGVITLNTWQFMMFQKIGSTTKIFVDGTEVLSTGTDVWPSGNDVFYIGGSPSISTNVSFMDDIRVTRGVGRPNSVPIGPFPDS